MVDVDPCEARNALARNLHAQLFQASALTHSTHQHIPQTHTRTTYINAEILLFSPGNEDGTCQNHGIQWGGIIIKTQKHMANYQPRVSGFASKNCNGAKLTKSAWVRHEKGKSTCVKDGFGILPQCPTSFVGHCV